MLNMTNVLPDFAGSQLRLVATTLKERYGEEMDTQLADAEMQFKDGAGGSSRLKSR